MRELALFAGAGGGILGGVLLGWRTVCAVEINAFCARRLMQRQNEGHLPPFPVWDDVSTFDGRPWRGVVDVVSGGFPCQDISSAGQRTHFKRLPTPTAARYGSNRGGANGRTGKVRPSLEALTGGPWISFREWMMAWPLGWSGSAPLATDRFQQWLDWHGRHSDHGHRDHK